MVGKAVIFALIATTFIKLFLFDFIITEGDSMYPAIQNGSVLIVNRLQYGFRFPGQSGYLIRWGAPKQGDIVVFYTPCGNLAVKRSSLLSGGEKFLAYGDNSIYSYDSRSYGPVPVDNTIGKVLGR